MKRIKRGERTASFNNSLRNILRKYIFIILLALSINSIVHQSGCAQNSLSLRQHYSILNWFENQSQFLEFNIQTDVFNSVQALQNQGFGFSKAGKKALVNVQYLQNGDEWLYQRNVVISYHYHWGKWFSFLATTFDQAQYFDVPQELNFRHTIGSWYTWNNNWNIGIHFEISPYQTDIKKTILKQFNFAVVWKTTSYFKLIWQLNINFFATLNPSIQVVYNLSNLVEVYTHIQFRPWQSSLGIQLQKRKFFLQSHVNFQSYRHAFLEVTLGMHFKKG